MAQGFAAELVGVIDGTLTVAAKSDGRVVGAKVRVFQATLDLANAAVKRASGDTNVCVRLPAGSKALFGTLLSSVTLATTTVEIGTAAAPGKYRASAVHTTPNVPVLFMLSSAADDAPLGASEDVLIKFTTADAPAVGIVTILIFASAR